MAIVGALVVILAIFAAFWLIKRSYVSIVTR